MTESRAEEAGSANDLPIDLQVGLDLLAAWLNPRGGTGVFVAAQGSPIRSARRWLAEPWVDESNPETRARRVLCLLDDPDEALVARALERLAPGGRVGIVAPGTLTLLRRRRSPHTGARWPLRSSSQIRVEMCAGIGRPSALVWGACAQLAERADRLDLADRLGFLYRRAYTPHGQCWLAARVALVASRVD